MQNRKNMFFFSYRYTYLVLKKITLCGYASFSEYAELYFAVQRDESVLRQMVHGIIKKWDGGGRRAKEGCPGNILNEPAPSDY